MHFGEQQKLADGPYDFVNPNSIFEPGKHLIQISHADDYDIDVQPCPTGKGARCVAGFRRYCCKSSVETGSGRHESPSWAQTRRREPQNKLTQRLQVCSSCIPPD